MAQTTEVNKRIWTRIRSLNTFIHDLPGLEEEWSSIPSGVQSSFSLEWDQLMTEDIQELTECYNLGELTEAQRSSYRELLHELKEVMPIVEKLNWHRPSVPVDIA